MRHNTTTGALALALLVCCLALPAEAYRRGERLDFGVVGEVTREGLRNPTNLLAIDVLREILPVTRERQSLMARRPQEWRRAR
ncbi:MAG: hypothetical protein ACE5ED_04650 [Rhodothalassiaceae bacterium]